jgi:transketolase
MTVPHAQMANAIRALAMDAVEAANSGHPGMPMGMADVATILFTRYLKFDPARPDWPDRDRFVLSAGHGSMLIYSILHLAGYARPTMDDIRAFRQLGSPCAGHPENFELPGVEVTTGPLGQGLAMSVGLALAERHLNAAFGDELVDHRTYVIAGDGCLMEGISQEAISLAGHLKLGRLIVLWDDNRISIDGPTSIATSEDMAQRFEAAGWQVLSCDGHHAEEITAALDSAVADARPSLIACRTVIGYGAPSKQGTEATHGAPLGADEIAGARSLLGWTHPPFELPQDVAGEWADYGARGKPLADDWYARLKSHPQAAEFSRRVAGELPAALEPALAEHVAALIERPQPIATRKASELALEIVNRVVPEVVGGSADLTGSNNTKTKGLPILGADNYGGRYIHYGVREFGMAAAMNGLALHRGIIPYGGTFLVFSDYCRPAIRLSALQRARVVYVMTHDSIGLGEDGPTHQPVEHLTSLRLIPNLAVFRPADAVETAECWALALARTKGPSVIALSRQNLAQLRREATDENLCARGGYLLTPAKARRRVVFLATGSELQVAVGAAELLEAQGVGCDVVSVPCWSLLDEQSPQYRANLLPDDSLLVSVEAGSTRGWEHYTGRYGLNIGLDSFGASAPAPVLYKHFGFTPEGVATRVKAALTRAND